MRVLSKKNATTIVDIVDSHTASASRIAVHHSRSTTCLQEVADRYITLTLEMARTYRRLEGDYENKIEG